MKFKIKKLQVKPDSKGAEAGMRSGTVKDALKNIAQKLASDLYNLTSDTSDERWEVEESSHSDRPVFNVMNDDESVKWREVADGEIAREVQSQQKKAPPRGRSGNRVRR